MVDGTLIGLAIGCGIGAGAGVLLMRGRHRPLQALLDDRTRELEELRKDWLSVREEKGASEERARQAEVLRSEMNIRDEKLSALLEEIAALREERSRLQTQMEAERKGFEEQKALLDEAQQKLADSFNALSSDALRKNNQAFLELAQESLQKFNKEASGDLEKRQQAIDGLVTPLKESLQKVDEQIHQLEQKRTAAYATLSEQVKTLTDSQIRLQSETSNLVKALRNPNQRGRWGEIQLRRVVEMADMLPWCDFTEQQSVTAEGNVLRPDMTVRLPNKRTIVVDSKTPLDAYLRAIEAQDDVERAEGFKAHARQVREQIRLLSSKRYWDQFDSTPDLVVMFIPGDPVFGAALEHDPTLIEYGVENRVLIATPVTLIGLLRSIAYGWRQEHLEENAQKISQLGRDLYARLALLVDHFSRVGKNLDRAVVSYNEAVGSLEHRVLPQARKFKELQAATSEDIEALTPVERVTRSLPRPELKTATIVEVSDLFAEAAN